MRVRSLVRAALIGYAVAAVVAAGAAEAHEIGTTRVDVVLASDGRYLITVTTDATALVEKVESVTRQPRSRTDDPATLHQKLEANLNLIASRTEIVFDQVRAVPAWTIDVSPSAEPGGVPAAKLVLTGLRDPKARAFTWAFGWTFASYAMTVHSRAGAAPVTQWIEGRDTSAPVPLQAVAPPPSHGQLAVRYATLGFTHILPKGIDHVLFVLGVFLLSRRIRPILAQVSAFTVAHSITLGLSMYGVVAVSPSIVEPLIALSIAYIALENLVFVRMRPWRVGLVFAFGLLHGLGFAGALKEVGLPRSEFVTALVGFNAGVELGQLTVIAGALLSVGLWCGDREWYRRRIVMPASACIGLLGVFWTIQRLHLG